MNDTMDDYSLIEKLGEGAAGEVFLATPTKDKTFARVGELVALKRYKSDILQKAHQFERIEREFKVGSTLAHPNLVRIYEYSPSVAQAGPPYLVMEYVDGVPLDKWIVQYFPLPRRLLLQFAEQLIRGISHLHENGILHRDLKPQNIMITSTFDVKIMDFGVVRVKSDLHITPSETFLGTIRNSSPEMLFGKEYDERSDLYSLGTIFYALLHGDQVFAEEKQFARLVSSVRDKSPTLDLAAKRDDVSSALFGVTQKLLEKSPERRYRHAPEIQEVLQPVRNGIDEKEPFEPLHGYIATALTGLDRDARDAIMFASSRISQLSKDYDLYVYEPRKATDPLLHQDVDPSVVYRIDRRRVLAADLLLVIANQPSFGVGQEIEIATAYSIPTILLIRDGSSVSRMVTGSPANILEVINYQTPEDLERRLRGSLAINLDRIRQWHNFTRQGGTTTTTGQRFAKLRRERGFDSVRELADSVGVSPRLLQAFEHGDYENVPVYLVDRLAAELGTSFGALMSPTGRRRPASPRKDPNITRLENTARKLGWSAASYLELRDDYQSQLAAKGESSSISEEQWVHRHNKLDERRVKESAWGETPQGTLPLGRHKE
jgi:serine/threonine protein kinase/transcriptional regulator with XRE-family HTH domain